MDEQPASEASDAHERVVVTGLGVVCPRATDVDGFWDLLHAPPRPGEHQAATHGGSAALARLPPGKAQYLDDTSSYAIAAAEQALIAAGLYAPGAEAVEGGDEMGLSLGTLSGPIKWGLTHGYADALTDPLNPPVPARAAVVAYYGSAIGNVTITFRIAGPALVFCNLDVAGTDAIGYAYESIRHGKARVMLAGGTDSPLNPLVLGELGRSGLLDGPAGGAPLLAEGAALLVLESLSSARQRGARIHAEVVCYATGTAGIEPAGRGAIDWSGVDCVVTTGPLQPSLEDRERRALEGLFQALEARPPVTQVNWAVGHTLGAAGALQALASVLVLERRHVPGVWGADAGPDGFYQAFPGAACGARRVLQVTRSLSGKTALLVFERWGQA